MSERGKVIAIYCDLCDEYAGEKQVKIDCPCGHKITLGGYSYSTFVTITCPGCKFLLVVNLSAEQRTESK
jgi:hypothetical protein